MSQTMLAIAGLGTPELVIIVLVIFLLFGATRLPQLAKALGQSKKAFRKVSTKPNANRAKEVEK
jgi:sec-independent protein translocase protein TatA